MAPDSSHADAVAAVGKPQPSVAIDVEGENATVDEPRLLGPGGPAPAAQTGETVHRAEPQRPIPGLGEGEHAPTRQAVLDSEMREAEAVPGECSGTIAVSLVGQPQEPQPALEVAADLVHPRGGEPISGAEVAPDRSVPAIGAGKRRPARDP